EALRQATDHKPDPAIESIILYTLASCYVTTNQKARAEVTLRQCVEADALNVRRRLWLHHLAGPGLPAEVFFLRVT
ncbi:MAG: hypothetical protein M3Y81_28275, partial [Chloroflexota bacterium]|nr:hypothetical protein [Chloroflexota bacterium]